MKHHLKDVTFLIPVRIDSIIRLENLIMVTKFIERNFETNIFILHADKYDNGLIPKSISKSTKYAFIEDYDPVFYRTKYINIMSTEVTTPIIAVWDADVIIPCSQIMQSVNDIRNGYDVSYPYDGHFYDTTQVIRELYLKRPRIDFLERNHSKMSLIYGTDMRGGGFFVNRLSYEKSGKENENFYGWGPEDWERFHRWTVLEYKISRTKGNLYHLTHSRTINSKFRSWQQFVSSNKEYYKNMGYSKQQIQEKNK